ncbi:MAG: OmpA family protein [Desulfovibrionaceae bacterium]
MMKKLLLLMLAGLTTALLFAGPASAREVLTQKVDNFIILLDHSGSMGQQHTALGEAKIVIAKKLLKAMNAKIPALEYKAAFETFSPSTERVALGKYDKAAFDAAIDPIETEYEWFLRLSPVGTALTATQKGIDATTGKIAVILVSDGEKNLGPDPVLQADLLYAKELGRLCFHVISLADKPAGQKVLDGIAALKDCSVSATAKDLMDDAAMSKFVKDVFYDVSVVEDPKPKAMPAPAAAPKAMIEEVITFRGVNFDFDSAKIKSEMAPVLDEAVEILKGKTGKVELAGHTDWTGPDAYNQGLSERRANAVKAYFVKKGLDAARIDAKGYGESQPKYDNKTAEGRKLNRRVEITLK